jgi:hypothetical protein
MIYISMKEQKIDHKTNRKFSMFRSHYLSKLAAT